MAWVGLVAMAGGALMSAKGDKDSAAAQAQQQEFAAQQDVNTADSTQAMGYQQAKRIREQGQSTVGQARAALGASGVDVNTGTSNDIQTKITQNTETDALNTILNTDQKATALRQQAFMETQGAADSLKAGQTAALTSVLKAGSSAASSSGGGWKTAAQ